MLNQFFILFTESTSLLIDFLRSTIKFWTFSLSLSLSSSVKFCKNLLAYFLYSEGNTNLASFNGGYSNDSSCNLTASL